MPIRDYGKDADTSYKALMKDHKVSDKNKEYLNLFLDAYRVSPARKNLFLKHIQILLRELPDIKKQMNDRALINKTFAKFRDTLSNSYNATVLNVSLRFVRWLNDGDKPKGFKDIKNTSKKDIRRDLRPQDMVTWEDGLNMIKHTSSTQIHAILMTQLDGGFRPSEFIDMRYGDIQRNKNFMIARVKGKTGSRDVILFKSVPYLQRWLIQHPIKKDDAPLWIIEQQNKSHGTTKPCLKYTYHALLKRISTIGKAANIKKPLDFYNLRHSACTLSKMDNVNSGLAAQKFGHSVEYYEGVYGRLDTRGNIRRFEKTYGIGEDAKEKETKTRYCETCQTVNEPGIDFCQKCNNPLTLDAAKDSYDDLQNIKKFMKEFKTIPIKEIMAELKRRGGK